LAAVLLHELVGHAAHADPDRPALVTDAGVATFAQLRDRIEDVAGGLAALTAPGDRVAILAENRAEYVECYYAVPRAGRVLVPLNHRLHRDEWLGALHRADARVLVVEPDLLERLGADAARAAGVATVVGLDGVAADVDYAALDRPPVAPEPEVGPDDVAWLVGTSGTTGTPKLAMLTHTGLRAAVLATLAARPVGRDDTLLTPFPLCHVAGYNVLVLHHAARPIVVMRRFDPVRLLALVAEHAVTMLSLAPTMIAMLLEDERADPVLRTVRAIGYGASAIPAPVLRAAVDRWGCDLSQGYGMTELSGNAVFLGPDDHRAAAAGDTRLLDAAGRPAPDVHVRLDPATGEILVRAPQEMAGYWEDPDATAAAFAGGWLHTGDVGRLDADGLLTVVDRLKDVIVSGGENVASREVETVLFTHAGIADVAVIGVPDPRWGERVTAVVVRRDGATVTADELMALSRAHLAGYKTPRAVQFVDALPRNAAGKVLKQQLREEFGTAVE
jgi:acyl-CoA synthetase (AMP-forming)/AMP-acid ligase II